MKSQMLPFFKYEKYCKNYKKEPDKIVPFKLFFQIQHGKSAKNEQGNDFLDCFQLRGAVNRMPDSVSRHLKAIFKKSNAPAHQNYYQYRR